MFNKTAQYSCFIIICIFLISFSCKDEQNKNKEPILKKPTVKKTVIKKGWSNFTIPGGFFKFNGKQYYYKPNKGLRFYFPRKAPKAIVILLHGWNQSMYDWSKKTGAANLAETYGLILVTPDMGKSNYNLEYYKETKIKWSGVPGTHWIGKILVNFLWKKLPRLPLYVIGVSTGARGALMIGEHYPVFKGVGYMSGDFDINLYKDKDKLSTLYYGNFFKFEKRWWYENTRRLVQRLKAASVFVCHGHKDKTVRISQTELLIKSLEDLGIRHRAYLDKEAGHTWKYWSRRLTTAFRFWFDH